MGFLFSFEVEVFEMTDKAAFWITVHPKNMKVEPKSTSKIDRIVVLVHHSVGF
jgi:hypothetical protein